MECVVTKDQKLPSESADSTISIHKLACFGPPPLFEGEESAAYDELLARNSAAVNPKRINEEIWAREFDLQRGNEKQGKSQCF
jgi:hypothetical protein